MDSVPLLSHRYTFLSLPLEIRLQIYDLALARRLKYGTVDLTIVGHEFQPVPQSSALLRSNRQIHAEAAPTLYSSNIFMFSDPKDLDHWLTQIGSTNSGSVRHLQLALNLCISLAGHPRNYEMLYPFDPDRLTFEVQGARQYWSSLFQKLSSEALGLRTLSLGFWWTSEFTGFGSDPERLVEEIGRLRGLERIDMEGMVSRKWVDSLRQTTGAKVLDNGA